MAENVKESMPVSSAGLTRFDEIKPAIQIKPEYVVVATIALIAVEIALKFSL